ncbi:MAG: FadR/GntR family transcriptional regulator [Azospirillaceae bacterium]
MTADAAGFTPIARESLAEKVARRILAMVRAGELGPGDQLPPERDLAARLQVSRPSVREALRGLAILGVVRSRQGGGAYISGLDAADLLEPLQFYLTLDQIAVDQLYEARQAIETTVARLAAGRITEAAIEELAGMLAPQRRLTGDPAAFRTSDLAFHEIIWRSCGNPFMERVARSLNLLGMDYRQRVAETPAVLGGSIDDHERLVEAFRARSPEAAATAMAAHMLSSHRSTLAGLPPAVVDEPAIRDTRGARKHP